MSISLKRRLLFDVAIQLPVVYLKENPPKKETTGDHDLTNQKACGTLLHLMPQQRRDFLFWGFFYFI